MTPIPQRLADRPTQGGLVVPWISVELANGSYDLGNMQNTRANQCFVHRLCQICGQRLTRPIVFLMSEPGLADMTAGEPPLHPECAAYSKAACPMVNGRMRHYRSSPTRTEGEAGKTCTDPGCDCGGWQSTPGQQDNAGRPAESWFVVWCDDYAITVPDEATRQLVAAGRVPIGKTLGARITEPLKTRAVTR